MRSAAIPSYPEIIDRAFCRVRKRAGTHSFRDSIESTQIVSEYFTPLAVQRRGFGKFQQISEGFNWDGLQYGQNQSTSW